VGVAAAGVVAAAALVVGPKLTGDEATSTPSATTSFAPYTIKPEPSEVAVDAPVELTGGQVDVVLSYAAFDEPSGTVQANGFVAGVIEDGGACTLTLTKGDDVVAVTSTAAADASTTSCGLLESPADLDAGTWEAVLAYSSSDADGVSRPLEVTVR
jgi:hypothetical protein